MYVAMTLIEQNNNSFGNLGDYGAGSTSTEATGLVSVDILEVQGQLNEKELRTRRHWMGDLVPFHDGNQIEITCHFYLV